MHTGDWHGRVEAKWVKQVMGFGRLQSRGQVTIPLDVRQEAGIAPGDVILFQVVERGRLLAVSLPRHTSMEAVLARFGSEGSPMPGGWDRIGDDIAQDVLQGTGRKDETHA